LLVAIFDQILIVATIKASIIETRVDRRDWCFDVRQPSG
jgi:hypothetical protein